MPCNSTPGDSNRAILRRHSHERIAVRKTWNEGREWYVTIAIRWRLRECRLTNSSLADAAASEKKPTTVYVPDLTNLAHSSRLVMMSRVGDSDWLQPVSPEFMHISSGAMLNEELNSSHEVHVMNASARNTHQKLWTPSIIGIAINDQMTMASLHQGSLHLLDGIYSR